MALPLVGRTALVDDDGTGTVGSILNNAWQTANIFAPIDALIAALVIPSTSWVTYDASGASLVFTGVTGKYIQIGPLLVTMISLAYPSTVNGSGAAVGLPFASVGYGGGIVTYAQKGASFTASCNNSAFLTFWDPSGVAVPNSALSLKTVNVLAVCFLY
jgi:hypothetical protein